MSLPPATERELIQTRSVEVSSYRRTDGLWEVEGRLVDTAAFAIPNKFRGDIEAGDPIHDMNLRLTLDANVEITEVHAAMDSTPYAMCPAIESAFQKLKGVRIGPGWNRKIRELLGGAQGCIHMKLANSTRKPLPAMTTRPIRSIPAIRWRATARWQKNAGRISILEPEAVTGHDC